MNWTLVAAVIVLGTPLVAQETKPVPKDSVRVAIPGCSKGYIFTAGPRTVDEAGSTLEIREGMHLRMSGPKKLIAEIKAHEGSMIQIVGIMKRGQFKQGIRVGGVGISAGPTSGGGISNTPVVNQMFIDVEGWRPVAGSCPTR